MNYGFIGFGNLAQALHQGLKDKKHTAFGYISKSSVHKGIKRFKNLKELASFADVLWLCVKPQNTNEITEQLNDIDMSNKLLVSAVAGRTIHSLEKNAGCDMAILRIMPNLAIAYKKSVTAYSMNDQAVTDKKSLHLAKKVIEDMTGLGVTIKLNEANFDLFTALFGSGPAFVLEMMDVFNKKAKKLGLSDKQTKESIVVLLEGTTLYLRENAKDYTIRELIKRIASKGGTTEAGLNHYKKNNLRVLLESVINVAVAASKKIRTQYKK